MRYLFILVALSLSIYSNAQSWSQLGADIDGDATGHESGHSVAISEDGFTVAVGATYDNPNKGQVKIFRFKSGSWTQIGSTIGSTGGANSGWSISLSDNGNIVAIGARGNDGGGSLSGHVRVYQYSGGSWTLLGSGIDGAASGDLNGTSVSLSSDGMKLATGAPGVGTDRGHARVYEYSGGS